MYLVLYSFGSPKQRRGEGREAGVTGEGLFGEQGRVVEEKIPSTRSRYVVGHWAYIYNTGGGSSRIRTNSQCDASD